MANHTVKKLKHLRRMLKNIPKENIYLGDFVSKWNPENFTECVMCAAGWIATDPFLAGEAIWIEDHNGDADLKSHGDNLTQAAVEIFGMSEEDCDEILYNFGYPKDKLKHKKYIIGVIDGLIFKYDFLPRF
jgi:hypothetical protein